MRLSTIVACLLLVSPLGPGLHRARRRADGMVTRDVFHASVLRRGERGGGVDDRPIAGRRRAGRLRWSWWRSACFPARHARAGLGRWSSSRPRRRSRHHRSNGRAITGSALTRATSGRSRPEPAGARKPFRASTRCISLWGVPLEIRWRAARFRNAPGRPRGGRFKDEWPEPAGRPAIPGKRRVHTA